MTPVRVLVANRGEIAVRVIRACHELGLEAVAVHSDADAESLHVRLADSAVAIGPAPAAKSYLSQEAVLAAALACGADAVHPGYGFLSENAAFARAVVEAGLIWIGPRPEVIDLMGDKARARLAAQAAGVPLVPGSGVLDGVDSAAAAAGALGYPVLLKAAAGGGGRGIRPVPDEVSLAGAFVAAQREVAAAFGDPSLYLEKALTDVRHIEVQILADRHGNVVHLYDRDCSLQRRRQKMIEEAPAPGLDPGTRNLLCRAAVDLARSVGYDSAGTVEFLVSGDGTAAFIEMNTRIQVEHGVTEMVTGVDLVQRQIRSALGEQLDLVQDDIVARGVALEVRINAEDPSAGFAGSPGLLTTCTFPSGPGLRIDTGVENGSIVQPFYDSLLAKLLVHAEDRDSAIRAAVGAIDATHIAGVATTLRFSRGLLEHDDVRAGTATTTTVEDLLASGWWASDAGSTT